MIWVLSERNVKKYNNENNFVYLNEIRMLQIKKVLNWIFLVFLLFFSYNWKTGETGSECYDDAISRLRIIMQTKLWSYVPGIKSSLTVSPKCRFLPVILKITRYKYCTYVLRITLTQVYWIVLPYYIFEVPTDNTINSTCCFLNIINSNRNKQRLLNYQNRTVDILSITQQH